jgi:hypothetical protein
MRSLSADTSTGVRTERHRADLVPYLIPPVSALALYVIAELVRHYLAADAYAWYWSLLTAGLYICLAVVAWRASRARGRLTSAVVTAGATAGAAWSWWAAGVPELSWRPRVAYLLGALTFCACSWLLSLLRHGQAQGDNLGTRFAKAVTDVRNINSMHRTIEGTLRADIEMQPGATPGDLDTKALASIADVPLTGIRVTASTDSARRASIEVDPSPGKIEPTDWVKPSLPLGASMLEPFIVGTITPHVPSLFYLAGDTSKARNVAQILLVGMNGAGKSDAIRITLVEGLTRHGFEYDYGNPRKADQEPEWVLRGARRVAKTNKEVVALLRDLRDEEIPRRSKLLGTPAYKEKHDQWHPDAIELGVNFRVVVLDEIAGIAQDIARLLTDLGETVRSLGIVIIAGLQRSSGSRFPTDARSQFGMRWVFGVESGDDADMALSDVMEGALPELWANRVPGMHYLCAPGTDERYWSTPRRTFRVDRVRMAKWADYLIDQREAGSDPRRVVATEAAELAPTAATGGSARPSRGGALAVPGQRAVRPVDEDGDPIDEAVVDAEEIDLDDDEVDEANDLLAPDFDDDEDDGEDVYDEDLEDVEASVAAEFAQPDAAEAAELAGMSARPIPAPDVTAAPWVFRGSVKMTDEQARTLLRARVVELALAGERFLKADAEAIVEVLESTGKSGSWVRKWLDRMCEGDDALLSRRGERLGYDILPAAAKART